MTGNTSQVGNYNTTGNTTQYGNTYLSGTSLSGQCALFVDGNVCIDGDVRITGDTLHIGDLCLKDANSAGSTGTACLGTNLIPTSGTTYHEFQNKNGTLAHLGDLTTGEPNSKGYLYMENNNVPTSLSGTPVYVKMVGVTSTIPSYLNFFTTGSSSNQLVYTYTGATGGTVTYLKYNISHTSRADSSGRRVTFALIRTSFPYTTTGDTIPAAMTVYTSGQNQEVTGTLTGIVSAQYLDKFEFYASNTSNSGPGFNLVVSDFTMSLFT